MKINQKKKKSRGRKVFCRTSLCRERCWLGRSIVPQAGPEATEKSPQAPACQGLIPGGAEGPGGRGKKGSSWHGTVR